MAEYHTLELVGLHRCPLAPCREHAPGEKLRRQETEEARRPTRESEASRMNSPNSQPPFASHPLSFPSDDHLSARLVGRLFGAWSAGWWCRLWARVYKRDMLFNARPPRLDLNRPSNNQATNQPTKPTYHLVIPESPLVPSPSPLPRPASVTPNCRSPAKTLSLNPRVVLVYPSNPPPFHFAHHHPSIHPLKSLIPHFSLPFHSQPPPPPTPLYLCCSNHKHTVFDNHSATLSHRITTHDLTFHSRPYTHRHWRADSRIHIPRLLDTILGPIPRRLSLAYPTLTAMSTTTYTPITHTLRPGDTPYPRPKPCPPLTPTGGGRLGW